MANLTLSLILLISAGFRWWNNAAMALWHDEAFSALYLRYDWAEMMYRIGLDVHPPLYYIILRLWSYVAGDGLFALRLLSIVFGVLTVWAGYAFVRAAFKNERLALVAALALAINPFQIQYALEARMYTLGTFLLMLSSYFLVRALENISLGYRSKKYWWFYALAVAGMFYTHYFLFFSVAAQGVFVLVYLVKQQKFSILIWSAIAYAGAAVLYLPWIPTLLKQVNQVQENYWIPPFNRWSVPLTIWKMVFGGTGINNTVLIITTAVTALLIIYFIKKVYGFQKWHVLFGFLVPVAGSILTSLQTDIFLERYFVFASAYFVIFLVVTFYSHKNFLWRYLLISLLITASVFAFIKNWTDLGIKDKPGMAKASQEINLNAEANDKIYVGSSFIYFTFKYYNQTGIAPRLISGSPLSDIPHFSGTAILTQQDLILDLGEAKSGETVWLLWTTGFGANKPEAPENWEQINEYGFADSPGFKGTIYVAEYAVN